MGLCDYERDRGPGPSEAAHPHGGFDELIAEHAKPVLAYTRTILGDHQASEDVVQETLLRAWQHEDRLRSGSGSVRGWLLTVARNLALDRLRSAASRHERLSADGTVSDHATIRILHGRRADHADHADLVGAREQVTRLLASLSPAHRDVLAYTYLCGFDVRETASALGVAPGTVKSRRHYALGELRRRAAEQG